MTDECVFVRWFSKTQEWIDVDSDTKQGKLGITKFAANALGDIVHVDLPEQGDSFSKGESIVSKFRYFATRLTSVYDFVVRN